MKVKTALFYHHRAMGMLSVLMIFGFGAKLHGAEAERFTAGPFEIATVMKRIGAVIRTERR
jgi:hypothetical protein